MQLKSLKRITTFGLIPPCLGSLILLMDNFYFVLSVTFNRTLLSSASYVQNDQQYRTINGASRTNTVWYAIQILGLHHRKSHIITQYHAFDLCDMRILRHRRISPLDAILPGYRLTQLQFRCTQSLTRDTQPRVPQLLQLLTSSLPLPFPYSHLSTY
ncbi:hypothetical protein VTI28DRAFT_2470 [Corynascus sepedonium]